MILTRGYNKVEITRCVVKVFVISKGYQSGRTGIYYVIKENKASVRNSFNCQHLQLCFPVEKLGNLGCESL